MSKIRIQEVQTKSDWTSFIDLPWQIYKGYPNWVPPLRIAVRDTLDVKKNPFFKHAKMRPILAYQDGRLVGRAVGVIDDNHNQFHSEKVAFFGFYESTNDQNVANALLDDLAGWAKKNGMETVRGPMNPSTNHECGLLVEGFDDPPSVMMTYNPPYYATLFEKWGLTKSKDLYAYVVSEGAKFSERLLVQAEKVRKKGNIVFRSLNLKDFDGEVSKILEIYNDAWERNWGFVPMNEEEFRHMAKDMKAVIDPRLCLIAEVDGKAVGFALTLPDINQAIAKVKDGRLLPTGLFKLLWHLKGPARKSTINRCRILTLGVKKAYREFGLGSLFYSEYLKLGPALGYPKGEASWILEDNRPMNRALTLMCGEKNKTYRIYDRSLAN
ncbi:MAG: GNAT family N-acetyltransferase [Bdellovibrio sp.]|nr:GNAT family N-acetyltransferase [Bdellovibrio sp.]